jgi:hypothetical protein
VGVTDTSSFQQGLDARRAPFTLWQEVLHVVQYNQLDRLREGRDDVVESL